MIRRPPRSTLFPTRRSSDLYARCTEIRRQEDGERPSTARQGIDRKSTRLNSSHITISYAVFCLKKNKGRDHTPFAWCPPQSTTPPSPCDRAVARSRRDSDRP